MLEPNVAHFGGPWAPTRRWVNAWCLALLALPLWWALGVEQFVWPLLAGILTVGVARQRSWRVVISPVVVLWCVFLLAYLASGFGVDTTFRWVSFLRSLASLSTGALVYFGCRNAISDGVSARRLALTLVALGVLISGVALLGVLGLWRPVFKAPIAWVLPGWMAQTSFGNEIVIRSTGRWAFMPLIGGFFRPNSLFLFPTLFATALAILLPFSVGAFWRRRGGWRQLAAVLAVVTVVAALFFSASRTAWLATAVGGLLWLRLEGRRTRQVATAVLVVAALALMVGIAQPERVAERVDRVWSQVVDFRQGSTLNRGEVYEESLQGVVARPLFGYGTERDIDTIPYPAGSHSLFLAMLYRHGLVGFGCFVALMVASWRESRPPPGASNIEELTGLGPWVHAAVWVSGLTTVLITDVTVVVIWWTAVGLLAAASDLPSAPGPSHVESGSHGA